MKLRPLECVFAFEFRHFGKPGQPKRHNNMCGPQGFGCARTGDLRGPFLRLSVKRRMLKDSVVPDVQAQIGCVAFQPIAHLIFGGEHGPAFREGFERHVIVPNRIVQNETVIARPPLVPDARIFVDDQVRHTQIGQLRAKGQPALATTHNQHEGCVICGVLRGRGREIIKHREQRFAPALVQPDVATARPVVGGEAKEPFTGIAVWACLKSGVRKAG